MCAPLDIMMIMEFVKHVTKVAMNVMVRANKSVSAVLPL